eukprot:scaffold7346_cov245-Pinguiococcus_pyrenoidosus.AAC.24
MDFLCQLRPLSMKASVDEGRAHGAQDVLGVLLGVLLGALLPTAPCPTTERKSRHRVPLSLGYPSSERKELGCAPSKRRSERPYSISEAVLGSPQRPGRRRRSGWKGENSAATGPMSFLFLS